MVGWLGGEACDVVLAEQSHRDRAGHTPSHSRSTAPSCWWPCSGALRAAPLGLGGCLKNTLRCAALHCAPLRCVALSQFTQQPACLYTQRTLTCISVKPPE